MTLVSTTNYEYSLDGENWQKDPTFNNLSCGTAYVFYQRIVTVPETCNGCNGVGSFREDIGECYSCDGKGKIVFTETCTVCDGTGIKSYTVGDLNADDAVTDADAIYLLYYTLLPDLYPLH